jgi:hypothetical protein
LTFSVSFYCQSHWVAIFICGGLFKKRVVLRVEIL